MGSMIEINDTLKISSAEFPKNIETKGVYDFDKDGIRVFHPAPVRVFLVEDISGKWNFIGKVEIIQQTIDAIKKRTTGKFLVKTIYPDQIRKMMNENEAPEGKCYVVD